MPCIQRLSPCACTHARQFRARSVSTAPNAQRFAADSLGRGATNPLDTVLLGPRSIRLPFLYQRRQVSKESAREDEKLVLAKAVQPPVCLEFEFLPGTLDEVDLLISIFDTTNTGFIGFEDLCTLFSILRDKEWSDSMRFNEWCQFLGADPNRGLNLHDLGRLLSIEPTFIDEAFRLLGLEPTVSKTALAPSSLRVELLRTALDGRRSFSSRLAMRWKREYACLSASVLSCLAVSQSECAGHLAKGDADEALTKLVDSMHDLVDATISSAESWHMCFISYFKRAALDTCVEKSASFDASWAAKIAALLAQVRSVDSLRGELKEVDIFANVEVAWRYVLAIGALVPVLEEAAPQGLILPIVQLSKMKGIAKQIQCGGRVELSHPSLIHGRASTAQSKVNPFDETQVSKPVQPAARPLGPRQRKSLRAAAYVKKLSRRARTRSAPVSSLANYGEICAWCDPKRATTAPAAASRYSQSPFGNASAARLSRTAVPLQT